MSDELVPVVAEEPAVADVTEPPQPIAMPIHSRFLFVDVAAQRAKQLRRGARPRIERPEVFHRLERVAMREVLDNWVEWTLPTFKGAPVDGI